MTQLWGFSQTAVTVPHCPLSQDGLLLLLRPHWLLELDPSWDSGASPGHRPLRLGLQRRGQRSSLCWESLLEAEGPQVGFSPRGPQRPSSWPT